MKVYFFGWPGNIGGADTKLAHLLPLLRGEFEITVVPPGEAWLRDLEQKRQIESLGIPCALLTELPSKLDGWAAALCYDEFFTSGQAAEARRRGLRIAWSNEMMWLFPAERGALTLGLCDAVLFVSDAQRRALEPQYARILAGESVLRPFQGREGQTEGWISANGSGRGLRWVMTGNYIDAGAFPFVRRPTVEKNRPLVIGRLSRPDPVKFPPDFPSFYEALGLRHARFRVMGWGPQVAALWPRHQFDQRWELLAPLAEPVDKFLQSLDLFVYSLNPSCRESWGRAVVEAMLTGAIPLVPRGEQHHLRSLAADGESIFLCANSAEFGRRARQLEDDPALRAQMSLRTRAAAEKLCDPEAHRAAWRRLFLAA